MKNVIWIKQLIRKNTKQIKGIINTYCKVGTEYSADSWWDQNFYSGGIKSDASTISKHTSAQVAEYHYVSIELQILKYFFNNGIEIAGTSIVDIGSGAGHWLDFYDHLSANRLLGIDISNTSINYLKGKYAGHPKINLVEGKAVEVLSNSDKQFDIVNAIGVMFHITDDVEWEKTVKAISNALKPGGILVIGGHFGLFNNLNVQIDKNMNVNKRLRSKRQWKKTLMKAGFQNVGVKRNYAYLGINWLIPENNILFCMKR